MSAFRQVPVTLREAARFVGVEHRHNPVVRAHRWSVGAEDATGQLVGVVIVARVKARQLHHPRRAEVIRLCTDGTRNACSFLYGVACRIARAMGFYSLKTYTLASESGDSLRAVGAKDEGAVRDESWDRPSRARTDKHTRSSRRRWELLHETAHLCNAEVSDAA